MHTSTAVVATAIFEVKKVITEHEIGDIIEDFTSESLAQTLNQLIADQERLDRYKANCRVAAKKENWEFETNVLAKIYPKVE